MNNYEAEASDLRAEMFHTRDPKRLKQLRERIAFLERRAKQEKQNESAK